MAHNLFQCKKRPFPGSRARGSVRRASGFVQILIALIVGSMSANSMTMSAVTPVNINGSLAFSAFANIRGEKT